MWLYNNVEFTSEMIPENGYGFVYLMEAIVDGKAVSYIGKKNFYSNRKKKLSKKNLPTDKRKKTYSVVTKLSFQDYYSSNDVLKEAHKKNIFIKRTILKICHSSIQLSYEEVKHQFMYGVLESDTWLNKNILGKFYYGRIR